ncbi:hypothetical protein V2S84_26510, partial [Azotobacter chroococcum]|nr:hypothetical protein [Azotobacter chroococcum]
EVVVYDSALGQIGLGNFNFGSSIVCFLGSKIFIELNIGFVGGHTFTPGYGRYGASYSGKVDEGKKDFFN